MAIDPNALTKAQAKKKYRAQRQFTGVNLATYGHSYTLTDGSFVPAGQEYMTQIKNRFGFATHTSWGEGGLLSPEVFRVMDVGYSEGSPAIRAIGSKGVVILDCMFNDITRAGTQDTTKVLNRFKHALRSSLAVLTAGSQTLAYAGSGLVRSGTWSTNGQAASKAYPGNAWTTTVGDYIEYTVAGDTAHILGYSWDLAVNNNAPIVEVKVDGVVKTTINYGNDSIIQYARDTDGLNDTLGHRTDTITGMGGGTHTVRLTLMAGSVGQWFTEKILVPSVTPAEVVLVIDPLPTSTASMYATHVTHRPAFAAAARSIAAEFPSVRIVDLAEMSSIPAYFNADGLHPNLEGAKWMTDMLDRQAISQITRPVATLI